MKTQVLTKSAHIHSEPVSKKDEESLTAGKTTVTILLAFVFLAIVMGLSYLFTTGTK